MISSGKCLMLFLRRDLSFSPSVDRIFFVFFLGEGWGCLFEGGCLFNIFSLKGGANSKGGAYLEEGANSSIYGIDCFIISDTLDSA